MAITTTSIALDAGSCNLTGITDDERGGIVVRPQDYGATPNTDDGCDVGAFELVVPLDLSVTKIDSIDPVVSGSGPGNLTYTITVTNTSVADSATGVELSDIFTLPAGVTIDSMTPSQGTINGTSPGYTWTIGTIAANSSVTLTAVLTVDATASVGTDVISDTATIIALDQNDSNFANDSVTEATSIVDSTTPPSSDDDQPGSDLPSGVAENTAATLSKAGVLQGNGLGLPGEVITWTIIATAPSGSAVTNVVITDTFPSEVHVDAAMTTIGSVATDGQTITVIVPFLNAGDSAVVTVTTTIVSGPAGSEIVNTAFENADPNIALSATARVPVVSTLPGTGYGPKN
jgi:uncharacterized repeat protein (TIGR01451 family)